MPARAQLAWLLTAQPYPTGVHPRGMVSDPPCRSTSAAIAQQRVGLFRPDKVSSTTRDQLSMASAVDASVAGVRTHLCDPAFSSFEGRWDRNGYYY